MHFKTQGIWPHLTLVQASAPFFLTQWLRKDLPIFNFLSVKQRYLPQACEAHSTTLESTEPNAKGTFVIIKDVCQHVWKAMNYIITKVYNRKTKQERNLKK